MINCKQKIPFILAISLSVAGCELMGPELHKKMPLESVSQMQLKDEPRVVYQELENDVAEQLNENQGKIELYPGTGKFISHGKKYRSKTSPAKGEFSLNFDDADLGEVTKVILSDILSENYLLSPKVAGKVTLQTSQPLSRAELLPTLEMLLQINNAALVYQDGLYQIKPKAEALGNSAFSTYNSYKQKVPAGSQIRIVPVRNVAVGELIEIIKPLMQEKTVLHVDNNRNLLVIVGTAAELARAMDMVNAFDVDVMKGKSFGMFPLHNVEAAKMITELEQVFSQKDSAANGFFQFIEIERLNSILAVTHQPKYLKQIERWVLRLDKANTTSGGGVIVYRAQHVDAVKLAETLNEIFSKSGQANRAPSVAAGRKVVQVTNKNKKTTKKVNQVKKNQRSLSDVGEVKITADEDNNALIIVATAQDYSVVQRVIKKLDVMPLQVLIDATIVDVTLTDDLAYGIKWFLNHKNGGQNAASLNGSSFFNDALDVATSAAVATATGGFGYAFISNSGDINAVLSAEATKDNVNIISSPSIMVLNNQEATIQVAEERSLRTSESTNTSGGADNSVVTNTIQQRKAGVKVKVKPRVNANGLVILDVEQSVENFAPGAGTNGNPDILTRELQSKIAVQSGETIVLGGLISEQSSAGNGGIPVLHELPLIGPLFGNTVKNKRKTELVVLITPRVVRSKLNAREVTNEFKRKLSGIYEDSIDSVN